MYLLAVLFAAASMVACCGEQKKNADEACAEEACTECWAEEGADCAAAEECAATEECCGDCEKKTVEEAVEAAAEEVKEAAQEKAVEAVEAGAEKLVDAIKK